MPHHHHCGGGGGSFWGAFGGGFIGGLLGSFSRMPMIGGFFGGMPTMPMMGGMMMPTMMPTMPTMPTMGGMAQLPGSTGNTPATQTGEKDQFAGVRKLFPDYTFEEINGKYYVRNEDGVTEYESFDKMMDALVNTSENPNAEELAQIKAQAAQKGAIAEVQQELDKFKENNTTLPEGVTVSVVDDLSDENNRKYKIEREGKNPIYCDTIEELEVALAALKPAAAGPAEATSTATQQTTTAGAAQGSQSSVSTGNNGNSTATQQSTESNSVNWQFIESDKLFDGDAWFVRTISNNSKQKLRLQVGDGDYLNYDKLTRTGDTIYLNEKYRDKKYMDNIKLVDDYGNYIPAAITEKGTISVRIGNENDNIYWITLEEFLQHPDQYQLKDAPPVTSADYSTRITDSSVNWVR